MPRPVQRLLAVCCLFCLCLAGMTATAEAAPVDTARIMREVLAVLDGETAGRVLHDIGQLRKAGFVYQASLAVSEESCPVHDDKDQQAVLCGLITADRSFAFFFGRPEDVLRENRQLQALWGKALPRLTRSEAQVLHSAPDSRRAREIVEKFFRQQYAAFVEAAGSNEAMLRLFAAYVYGVYIERLYMASVMVLAAAEGGDLDPVYALHDSLSACPGKALLLLGKAGVLGPVDESVRRSVLVKQLQKLLTAEQGHPTLDSLREVVELTQNERLRYLVPCPIVR